ncbi:hypothetical protein HanIR_Chr00c26g0911041 [Helianthus annuus]|nr:hypothetical protein HanIR_Chr00c26g0911041 [Helianthus annuus]
MLIDITEVHDHAGLKGVKMEALKGSLGLGVSVFGRLEIEPDLTAKKLRSVTLRVI